MAISPLNSRASYTSPPVTLGKEAKSFAELAAKGVTFCTIADGQGQFQALLKGTAAPAGSVPLGLGGSMTASDFDQIMLQIGASRSQADTIRAGFDADRDGSITNAEMLHGLADLGASSNSPNSQLLMGLMDSNGNRDGVVQQNEFLGVETSLAYALKK